MKRIAGYIWNTFRSTGQRDMQDVIGEKPENDMHVIDYEGAGKPVEGTIRDSDVAYGFENAYISGNRASEIQYC